MRVEKNSELYFDEIANEWDEMRKEFFSENLREEAIKKANVQRGKRAIDIGAGTGFISEGLLSRGLKVTAVDSSEEMIKILKDKFENIESVQADGENIPINDKSAEYVFANMYLHHVENPLAAIKEMVRILKSDGKVVITDLDEHSFEFLRTEQHDRWLGFKRDDIKKWFDEAGLKNIEVECSAENCCADSNSKESKAKVSIFIASGEKK